MNTKLVLKILIIGMMVERGMYAEEVESSSSPLTGDENLTHKDSKEGHEHHHVSSHPILHTSVPHSTQQPGHHDAPSSGSSIISSGHKAPGDTTAADGFIKSASHNSSSAFSLNLPTTDFESRTDDQRDTQVTTLKKDVNKLTAICNKLDHGKYKKIIDTNAIFHRVFNKIESTISQLNGQEFTELFTVLTQMHTHLNDIAHEALKNNTLDDATLDDIHNELSDFEQNLEDAKNQQEKIDAAYTAFENGIGNEYKVNTQDSNTPVISVEEEYGILINDPAIPESLEKELKESYSYYKSLNEKENKNFGEKLKDILVKLKKRLDDGNEDEDFKDTEQELEDLRDNEVEADEDESDEALEKSSFYKKVTDVFQKLRSNSRTFMRSVRLFATNAMDFARTSDRSLRFKNQSSDDLVQGFKKQAQEIQESGKLNNFVRTLHSKCVKLVLALKNRGKRPSNVKILSVKNDPEDSTATVITYRPQDDDKKTTIKVSKSEDFLKLNFGSDEPAQFFPRENIPLTTKEMVNREFTRCLTELADAYFRAEDVITQAIVQDEAYKKQLQTSFKALYKKLEEHYRDFLSQHSNLSNVGQLGKLDIFKDYDTVSLYMHDSTAYGTDPVKIFRDNIINNWRDRTFPGTSNVQESEPDAMAYFPITYSPGTEEEDDVEEGLITFGDESKEGPVKLSLFELLAAKLIKPMSSFFKKMSTLAAKKSTEEDEGDAVSRKEILDRLADQLQAQLPKGEPEEYEHDEDEDDEWGENESSWDPADTTIFNNNLTTLTSTYEGGPSYTIDQVKANTALSRKFLEENQGLLNKYNLQIPIGRGGKLQLQKTVYGIDNDEDEQPGRNVTPSTGEKEPAVATAVTSQPSGLLRDIENFKGGLKPVEQKPASQVTKPSDTKGNSLATAMKKRRESLEDDGKEDKDDDEWDD